MSRGCCTLLRTYVCCKHAVDRRSCKAGCQVASVALTHEVSRSIVVPGLSDVGGVQAGVGLAGIMADVLDVANQVALLVLGNSL